MKKIGIMTYHNSDNYGSVLLAYAEQSMLEKLGYRVEIIDFCLNRVNATYGIFVDWGRNGYRCIPYNTYALINYKALKTKEKRYVDFRKRFLNLTNKKYASYEELSREEFDYTCVVAGGDQVWNCDAYVFDKAYFLGFLGEDITKIAYAPGLGASAAYSKDLNNYGKLISEFKFLSVREKESKKIIEKIAGKKANVVLDPVFLLEKKRWEEISEGERCIQKPYLLVYSIGFNSFLYAEAEKIAKKNNLQIVTVMPDWRLAKKRYIKKFDTGPLEFLNLIKYADFVCSNSFHATAFSIIFNKEFIFANGTDYDVRIENILQFFDIPDRFITANSNEQQMKPVKYDKINKLIKESRESVKAMIKEVLNDD